MQTDTTKDEMTRLVIQQEGSLEQEKRRNELADVIGSLLARRWLSLSTASSPPAEHPCDDLNDE